MLLPLQVIFPIFSPGVEPECILDGGAQVVVMGRDVWERLNVPIAAKLAMPMESANASTTMTLELIQNHPVQLSCQEIGLVAIMFFFELLFSYVSPSISFYVFLTNLFSIILFPYLLITRDIQDKGEARIRFY